MDALIGWMLTAGLLGLATARAVSPDDPAVEDVVFKAKCDGTEQRYVLWQPVAFRKGEPRDALIVLHGHGSNRWQFITDARDECRAARDFATEHRLLYVSPDYRAATSWMGPKAEADVVQIIGDLRRHHRVARVFLCGASMGGAAALAFAVLHPDLIDGVASMNGTANFVEYENFQPAIRQSFGGTKDEVPREYEKRSAELAPERLTMPVGLAVSGRDTSVPPQSVLRLAERLKADGRRVRLIHRETRGHSTSYDDAMTILDFMYEQAQPREEPGPGVVRRRRPASR
jgi:pimeloyl-ACP methyl ester carboxylesterase